MKETKLHEKSSEDLLKEEKTAKTVTGALAGMLVTLFVLGIYLSFRQGFNTLVTVPLALLPIVLMNVNRIKEIRKELSARGERP